MNKSKKIMSSDSKNVILLTLKCEKTGKCYNLLSKKKHVVARWGFDGDLEIANDLSVSRRHAEITLLKKSINGNNNLCVEVIDLNSKFGTFINEDIDRNIPVDSGKPVILNLNDRIRFGRMKSIWTVAKYQIITCPSTLNRADKETLKDLVTKLGGQISTEWSENCTHLCMNSISITEKALLCLASAKPIVNLQYYIDLLRALLPISSSLNLPFCASYIPPLKEVLLNIQTSAFGVNNKRTRLFSGRTFVCSTKEQLIRIEEKVKASGGKVMHFLDIDMNTEEIVKSVFHIMMQQDPFNKNDINRYLPILEKLKDLNKRPIPENDISLGIINVSISKHCNPEYDFALVNIPSQPVESETPVILAPDTEIPSYNESMTYSVNIVPDSQASLQSFKRPREEISDSEDIGLQKKKAFIKTELKEEDLKEKINEEQIKDKITNDNMKIEIVEDGYHSIFRSSNCTQLKIESATVDSCLTTVPPTQEKTVPFLTSVSQVPPLTASTDVHNNHPTSNFNSGTKRKIQETRPIKIEDDDDNDEELFDYKDIDEIERPTKKPKNNNLPSIFGTQSSDLSIKYKSNVSNERDNRNMAIDPNYIMNLLADAKDTAQFIDTSILSNISNNDVWDQLENKELLNSVIIETKSMVITKSSAKSNNSNRSENFSSLPNFKKFKKKGPLMRIPHIVPLTLSQFSHE
ncbi:nibrin [Adelges cooleyi]|uniref:nibrin n=1 Tax=Adelges cooleyi TaxID=133065 RepID=UPI00217F8859|nr:nibrin [Adelges cooleyi]